MIETKEIKVRRIEESAKNQVEFHIRNSTSPWVAIEVYATHSGGTGQLGCPSGSLGHQQMLVRVFQNCGQLRLSH